MWNVHEVHRPGVVRRHLRFQSLTNPFGQPLFRPPRLLEPQDYTPVGALGGSPGWPVLAQAHVVIPEAPARVLGDKQVERLDHRRVVPPGVAR